MLEIPMKRRGRSGVPIQSRVGRNGSRDCYRSTTCKVPRRNSDRSRPKERIRRKIKWYKGKKVRQAGNERERRLDERFRADPSGAEPSRVELETGVCVCVCARVTVTEFERMAHGRRERTRVFTSTRVSFAYRERKKA